MQAKVDELAVAETLEVPPSPVSAGSNRTDTETVDLFWFDACVSGSDESGGGCFLNASFLAAKCGKCVVPPGLEPIIVKN